MRLIAVILLILLGLCWLAVAMPVTGTGPDRADRIKDDGWRRTTDGWERRSSWKPPYRASSPGLHPAVVGLLELQLSLAALIAFSPKPSKSSGRCLAAGLAQRCDTCPKPCLRWFVVTRFIGLKTVKQ